MSSPRDAELLRAPDLDQLYREHAPAITASLARSFGARRLDLIEAAVQEAFVSALESWNTAMPERPGAWLQVAARRRLVDALRRAAWLAPSDTLDELEAPALACDRDEDLLPFAPGSVVESAHNLPDRSSWRRFRETEHFAGTFRGPRCQSIRSDK